MKNILIASIVLNRLNKNQTKAPIGHAFYRRWEFPFDHMPVVIAF